MQTGTVIPESVHVQTETFCSDWYTITSLSGDDLDRQLRSDRWNFVFMAGACQAASWGSWSGTAIRCAAIRVLKKSKATKLNAFEITGIRARRFLGVPYVVVSGHSRHVQKSTVLQGIAERIHQVGQPALRSTSDGARVTPLPAPAAAK
jgi:hypothetical protein